MGEMAWGCFSPVFLALFSATLFIAACKLVNFYKVNRCNGYSKNASAVLDIIYFPVLCFLL